MDFASLFLRDERAAQRLPRPVQAEPGYRSLSDFTRKELLDLDACTKCGRCHVACPAQASGDPLSPRDLILELREYADETHGVKAWWRERRGRGAPGEATLVGTVVHADTLWACTTCQACMVACLVGIEHLPLIVQMRRTLVAAGVMDAGLQATLQKLARYGHSFGQSGRLRGRWTQGLPFRVKDLRREPAEFLWFVGDYASYNPRLQEISRLGAQVFHRGGVDFGILYDGERNAGNGVRASVKRGCSKCWPSTTSR